MGIMIHIIILRDAHNVISLYGHHGSPESSSLTDCQSVPDSPPCKNRIHAVHMWRSLRTGKGLCIQTALSVGVHTVQIYCKCRISHLTGSLIAYSQIIRRFIVRQPKLRHQRAPALSVSVTDTHTALPERRAIIYTP